MKTRTLPAGLPRGGRYLCWDFKHLIGTGDWRAWDPLPCTRWSFILPRRHPGGGRCLLPTPPCLYPRPFTTHQQATSRHELLPISFYFWGFQLKGSVSSRQVHGSIRAGGISNQTGSVCLDLSPDRYRCWRLSSMRRNHSWGLRSSDGSVRGRLHISNGGWRLLAEPLQQTKVSRPSTL